MRLRIRRTLLAWSITASFSSRSRPSISGVVSPTAQAFSKIVDAVEICFCLTLNRKASMPFAMSRVASNEAVA
jgi:hypothetical protein